MFFVSCERCFEDFCLTPIWNLLCCLFSCPEFSSLQNFKFCFVFEVDVFFRPLKVNFSSVRSFVFFFIRSLFLLGNWQKYYEQNNAGTFLRLLWKKRKKSHSFLYKNNLCSLKLSQLSVVWLTINPFKYACNLKYYQTLHLEELSEVSDVLVRNWFF